MNTNELHSLQYLSPCREGLEFCITQASMKDAWDNSPNGSWLIWYLQKKRLLSKMDSCKLATLIAELVLPIWTKKYPTNLAPQEAIQVAKNWIANPTEENRKLAYVADVADAAAYAADVADAAAYAAAAYVADVADVADAAADAADVADAADAAAAYAAYAAYATAAAAYAADVAAYAADVAAAYAADVAADAAAAVAYAAYAAANAAVAAAYAAYAAARLQMQKQIADIVRSMIPNPFY